MDYASLQDHRLHVELLNGEGPGKREPAFAAPWGR
jgi:hypothetical protein